MNNLVSAPWSINLRERISTLFAGCYSALAIFLVTLVHTQSITEAISNWKIILIMAVVVIILSGVHTLATGISPDYTPEVDKLAQQVIEAVVKDPIHTKLAEDAVNQAIAKANAAIEIPAPTPDVPIVEAPVVEDPTVVIPVAPIVPVVAPAPVVEVVAGDAAKPKA